MNIIVFNPRTGNIKIDHELVTIEGHVDNVTSLLATDTQELLDDYVGYQHYHNRVANKTIVNNIQTYIDEHYI